VQFLIPHINVADPGCFIPDHFRIPDPDPDFSSWILHENWNANLLSLASYAFQEQSLSLNHKDPGSGKNSSRIQVVKKHRIRIRNIASYWLRRVAGDGCATRLWPPATRATDSAMP
jgi:hypothetical protein